MFCLLYYYDCHMSYNDFKILFLSWRSAGLSPQQAIQELEMKLAQVQEQLEKVNLSSIEANDKMNWTYDDF